MDNKTVLNYLNAQAGGMPRSRIVVFGATADTVVLGTSATALLMGVTTELATNLNERVDVVHAGIEKIEVGAAFVAGSPITSDATGKAIVAATVGQRIVGFALKASTGAVGERVPVLIELGVF